MVQTIAQWHSHPIWCDAKGKQACFCINEIGFFVLRKDLFVLQFEAFQIKIGLVNLVGWVVLSGLAGLAID